MLLNNKKVVLLLLIALTLRLAMFLATKPWNKENYDRKVINQDAIMYNNFALSILKNHKFERRRGRVIKSDFRNKKLVLKLLETKVIENRRVNPKHAYFDDTIKNKDQLRERLKQIGISKIEPILAIWRQSQKDNPSGEIPPAYPLFIAAIYFIFGYQPYVVALLQIFIGTITCLLLYKLGTAMFDERVGLVAGYLLTFEYVSIMFEQVLYSDTLFTFLFIIAIYLLVKFLKTNHKKYLAYVGMFLGLAALCKPIGLYFPLVLLLFFTFSYIRRKFKFTKLLASGLIVVLSFWLTISPWVIRNYMVFGPPVLFTSRKSTVLVWYAACIRQAKTGVSYNTALRGLFKELEELTKDKHLSQSQIDKYREQFCLKMILENPLTYARSQLIGTLGLYLAHGGNIFSYLTESGYGWITSARHQFQSVSSFFKQEVWPSFQSIINSHNQWVKIFALLMIALFAIFYAIVIIGLIIMWQNKKFSAMLLLTSIIGYFTILSVPASAIQYRIPLMPYMMILAAYAIVELWSRYKKT